MALSFFSLISSFVILLGGPPVLTPARAIVAGMIMADGWADAEKSVPVVTGGDVYLIHLHAVDGLKAEGELLTCRVGERWQSGWGCDPRALVGKTLRVFTGANGELGQWVVEKADPKPVVADSPATLPRLTGKLSVPVPPPRDGGDALEEPFALLGERRHLIEVPATDGYEPTQLEELLVKGEKSARLARRLRGSARPEHYTVFDLTPELAPVVVVAASSYPKGPLDAAPEPSTSLLFAHADSGAKDGGDWTGPLSIQVITKATDTRKFERYRVSAVLDVDGDGWREVIVRGRSALGVRFRVYAVTDEDAILPVQDWAGVWQTPSAPRR